MSVHFFYNYKDELVKKLKERFAGEVAQWKTHEAKQKQLDDAEALIKGYFKNLLLDLGDVVDATGGLIQLIEEDGCLKFIIGDNYLLFIRQPEAIMVKMGYYVSEHDTVETTIPGYIVPGEKKPLTKKVGKIHDGSTFDENTLNYYLRTAFPAADFDVEEQTG